MSKLLSAWALALALLASPGCQPPGGAAATPTTAGPGSPGAGPRAAVRHIDAKAFAAGALRDGTSRPDVVVLDVRTPAEVAQARLPGASAIPLGDPRFAYRAGLIARDKPVYVYCATGARSAAAAERLVAMGFGAVFNLRGGILGWRRAGLPTERGGAGAAPAVGGLDPAAFDAKVRAAPALVEYETPWCTPCRRMAPRVQAAAEARRLPLLRVNIDASEGLAAREEVVGVPVLALFRDGREVARRAGECDEATLTAWLDGAGPAR
jgi:rhodanese-related sulfurtransferase